MIEAFLPHRSPSWTGGKAPSWQSWSWWPVPCPAQHFSGRAITDNNATLWASWAILGVHQKLYFSGEGGCGPHFADIGTRYGPFDLAMLECGQYNQAWLDIHTMPEQSVQVGLDVQVKPLMPIHWGAFQLSIHTWTDPIFPPPGFTSDQDSVSFGMLGR